jgi:uncharacterized membrane protein SpoIIM required for sporulation
MKETKFIAQNQAKWSKFEKERDQSSSDPDELGRLYAEISNDLSYAQTFYNRRTVRAYLNGLAQGVHAKLYKQKREPIKSILRAWTKEIPLEIYNARRHLLFALGLFLLWAMIGVVSSYMDPDFAEMILGSGYITVTEQNILDGNPLGIYGNQSQSIMFFQITLNNIGVALKAFFGGALFGLGTHIILFQNAIMVGAFQYFFKLKGLLLTSFLTIWIHGAFEISAIVIASGAGFTLGHGLLFPGSYSRIQSFQIHAKRGIRILISLIPIFIIAGFLESFVTRHYQVLPDWSKWLIILFSFAVVIFYYVVYPIFVARKYPDEVNQVELPVPLPMAKFNLFQIRNLPQVIQDTFQFYRMYFSKIMQVVFRVSVPMIVVLFILQLLLHVDDLLRVYFFDWASQLSILFGNVYAQTFNGISDVIVSVLWIFPITGIASGVFYAFYAINQPFEWRGYRTFIYQRGLSLFVAISLFTVPILFLPFYLLIPMVFVFPLLLLVPAAAALMDGPGKLKKGFEFSSKYWVAGLGALAFFGLTFFFLSQPIAFVFSIHDVGERPISKDLLDLFTEFVQQFLASETSYYMVVSNSIRQIVYLTALIVLLPLLMIATAFIFYSAREELEALGLKKELEKFGKRNRLQETTHDYED